MSPIKSVVITGVSTGIGEGCARVLARSGWRVFGSVRTAADGERLAREFGPNFKALVFDVCDEAGVARAAREVEAALPGRRLTALVNNAGICIVGPLALQPAGAVREQLEVNLLGPLIVTQAFLPLLGTDPARAGPPGRIVNISSVGGRMGPPFIGAYAASKHGLEGLSESWRRELQLHGIDVVIVGPGSVATPIWRKAGAPQDNPYRDSPWGPPMARFFDTMVREGMKGYAPEYIGRRLQRILDDPRPRWRYAIVPGRLANWTVPMLLPRRWVDRIIGRLLGLRPGPALPARGSR